MNVAAMHKHDEATVEDAKTWVRAMAERGKWSAAAARIRVTALDALASVLGPEDSRTAKSVLENVDSLHRDWARKNVADGATAATYGGSVRSTLKIYLEWLEDPAKAQSYFDSTGQVRARKPKAKPAEGETQMLPLTTSTQIAPLVAAPTATPAPDLRSYPLGEERVVVFGLPVKFNVRDLAKLTCHLATYCDDFDPARPDQGTVAAMMRVNLPTE